MLALAVCLLSASSLAGVVGLLGGPHHPNAVADDVGTEGHLVRTLVAVLVAAMAGVAWKAFRRSAAPRS